MAQRRLNDEQFASTDPMAHGFTRVAPARSIPFSYDGAEVRRVSLDDLGATQRWMQPDKVVRFSQNQKPGRQPINVTIKDGKLWADDGHHRAAGAMRRGQKTIKAIVYNADR